MDFRSKVGQQTFAVRATALIVENGKIFMIKNDDSYYTIGGAVKVGETLEEAVKREVFEEIGVDTSVNQLAFVVENFFEQGSQKFHNIEFHYLVEALGELPEFAREDAKKLPCEWLEIDKFVNYDVKPSFLKEKLGSWSGQIEHISQNE